MPPTLTMLREIKRRLSDRITQIPGVSGIGLPGDKLTVYLEESSETARQKVAALLKTEAPDTSVDFVVTGRFQPQ